MIFNMHNGPSFKGEWANFLYRQNKIVRSCMRDNRTERMGVLRSAYVTMQAVSDLFVSLSHTSE